jgi:Iap family predicted aminopeptidase
MDTKAIQERKYTKTYKVCTLCNMNQTTLFQRTCDSCRRYFGCESCGRRGEDVYNRQLVTGPRTAMAYLCSRTECTEEFIKLG